ncbi:MAG: septum site-determining protein MinC, partial [Anaerolineaceae bacterium]|nr:septum site-determining protein MinC [Anaerolineaceae bacterium]
RRLGIAPQLSPQTPERVNRSSSSILEGESAVLLQRTLRSGFKVAFQGHVVILGDVNPGAEIVAGGSVIVWGCLRGVVHAGAEGNEQAVVCALTLAPTQLRIAGAIAVTPPGKGASQPEIARLHEGQVVAVRWKAK